MKFATTHSALLLLAPRSLLDHRSFSEGGSEVGCGEKLKPKRSRQFIDSHLHIAEGAFSNDFQKHL